MPLTPGNSSAVKSSNISELMHTGRPQNQAIAIALSNARRHPRADGGAANLSYQPDIGADKGFRPTYRTASSAVAPPRGPDEGPVELRGDGKNLTLTARKNIGFARGGAAIDRAVRAASRIAKQHLADGGTPQTPFFERQEARDTGGLNIHPGGLVASAVPGRTDMHNISVPSGSYVLPADVVSGLGEGNTLAGAKLTDEMLGSGPYGTKLPPVRHGSGISIPHPPAPFTDELPSAVRAGSSFAARGGMQSGDGKPIPIVVAGGEYIALPDQVRRKGGGDIKRGHAWLDDFVKHVRNKTVKTLRKLPGPVK